MGRCTQAFFINKGAIHTAMETAHAKNTRECMYIILSWVLEHAYCLFCSLLHLKPCTWQSPTSGREEKIFPSSERTENPYKLYRCKEMLIIGKNDTICKCSLGLFLLVFEPLFGQVTFNTIYYSPGTWDRFYL